MAGRKPKPTATYFAGDKSADDVSVIIQDRCEIIMSERYGYYLIQVEELSKRDIVSEGKIDELLLDAFCEDIGYEIEAE